MINIPEIEKTARAATGGQWRQGERHYRHQVITEGYGLFPPDTSFGQYVILDGNQNFPEDAKKNVAHAASANPAAVLEMAQLIRELAGAANAVVKHWDTPAWKYEQHTGEVIAGLREALEKARQAGVTDHIEPAGQYSGAVLRLGG